MDYSIYIILVLLLISLVFNFYIYFNNKRNIKYVIDSLKEIENFIEGKINSFQENKNKKIDTKILDKIYIIKNKLSNKQKEELIVYGEVMIVCEKLSHGKISDKIYHTNISNKKLNYISKTINNLVDSLKNILGSDTDEILDILNLYSNKDFSELLKNDNNSKLVLSLNNVTKLISDMLSDNKSNGLTLNQFSCILLENVEILNQSSSQGAASLEETAAAIEKITSITRNNTENISNITVKSNKLTESAITGQELASQTSNSIDEISIEVATISEAISIIDQIAFQTNILSLNAAVEAASAGESGKGFAVVAQEVRNLSTRSANAAKDISKIVESANQKANLGKKIANKMIDGYVDLKDDISNTIALINKIETSSKEQLLGIEQINDEVNNLDKNTQENTSVANMVHNLAITIDKFAKIIVSNANDKNFIGKDSIKPKKIEL